MDQDQDLERLKKELDQIFQHWNITISSAEMIPKGSKSYKYELIFKLADFLEDFTFVGRMAFYIKARPYKLVFHTILVHQDLTPVTIKNPNTRFLIRRHILKLNSLLRFGSFSVDEPGLIKFHLMWNYETNAHLATKSKEDMEKWLKISMATTMSTLKVNMTKVLWMAEIIDLPRYQTVVEVQGAQIRQIPAFFNDHQKRLKEILIGGIKKKFGDRSDPPVTADTLPPYPYPFYQKVVVKDIEYHGRLAVGGYAAVHVIKAVINMDEDGKNIDKNKYFLVKVPRQPVGVKKPDKEYVLEIARGINKEEDPRIKIERTVLDYPKDKNFQHIARYYDDCREGPPKPLLYMENYMPQNLHEFNARKDLGMGTKLSWLYQLAHVLLYLEKNRIVHVDLKPGNIVVAKNFFLKVIDFAESVIKDDKPILGNDKRATTMPFSSPETLDDNVNNIKYESDVFSFAHIAYELLGGKFMIGFKRSSENKVRQKYKKRVYKLLPILNWLNCQGPEYLMHFMYHLIMLCTSPDPDFRFPQDALVAFIKEYALLNERMF